ncbi:hypothetical protein NRIC_17940 [Enterococcus florum]|uniref:Uncharacterized protein n=1 Tax=Enterococcus florum TaxID=2480627 RepID=A0A4P5PKP2_9ENTE|nr:hypothetical protein [Enterococcus florum]GCF93903.1 hypothetical protein NRIC_17940 [Enterococcus florum]
MKRLMLFLLGPSLLLFSYESLSSYLEYQLQRTYTPTDFYVLVLMIGPLTVFMGTILLLFGWLPVRHTARLLLLAWCLLLTAGIAAYYLFHVEVPHVIAAFLQDLPGLTGVYWGTFLYTLTKDRSSKPKVE